MFGALQFWERMTLELRSQFKRERAWIWGKFRLHAAISFFWQLPSDEKGGYSSKPLQSSHYCKKKLGLFCVDFFSIKQPLVAQQWLRDGDGGGHFLWQAWEWEDNDWLFLEGQCLFWDTCSTFTPALKVSHLYCKQMFMQLKFPELCLLHTKFYKLGLPQVSGACAY